MSQRTRRLRLNSLFVKVAFVIAVSVGAVAGTLTVMQWQSVTQFVSDVIGDRARDEAISLASQAGSPVRFRQFSLIEAAIETLETSTEGALLGTLVLSAEGEILVDRVADPTVRATLIEIGGQALRGEGGLAEPYVSTDRMAIAAPVLFGAEQAHVGAVAMLWTPEVRLGQLHADRILALLASTAIFAVAVIGAMFVLWFLITAPLDSLRAVIHAFSHKDFEVEVPLRGRGDELGAIGKALEDLRGILARGQAVELESTYKSAAFMGSSAAMLLTDRDLVVTYMNPAMTDLLRQNREVMRKQHLDFDPDMLVGEKIDRFAGQGAGAELSQHMQATGAATSRAIVTYGDIRISRIVSIIRDADGNGVGYVMEWSDVSESVLNAALVEAINSNQLMAEFAVDGRLLTANAPFIQLLGLGQSDLRRHTIAQLLSPPSAGGPDAAGLIRQTVQSDAFLGKLAFGPPGDTMVTVDGSLSCVKDHQGAPIRLLLLGKDVTRAEAELAAARAQRAQAEAQQTTVVEALRVGLRKLNSGDLTAQIEEPFAGNYEDLRRDYNDTVRNLSKALYEIAMNAENISNEARDISATADSLSRRTESTAATLEQTASALNLLTTSVKSTAEGVAKADQAVSDAKASAESSGQVVIETVSAMGQIANSSERITSIIKVIDDIAFQTNLLALNAGVEAARAGDAGRGFAVVASEVRALAQRSSDAAREINDLIANSGTQVKRGVELVGKTGDALRQIVGSVSEISILVSDFVVASREQSASLVEINSAVIQLDQSTQQNAARLEETTAASEGLTRDAVALVETVSHFKVERDTVGDPHSAPSRMSKGSAEPVRLSRDTTPRRLGPQPAFGAGGLSLARAPDPQGWEDF